jgi:cyclopropane fatty-acyl-phospholipid synthase-like methyltransferase
MTARANEPVDWTYLDARRRLVRAGQAQLPRHVASARLDEMGNRLVDCGCGWTGNGLGWIAHIDSVVRAALDIEITR